MTVARELASNTLDLVGVQGVRWDKGGTVRAGDYIMIRLKSGNASHHSVQNLSSSCLSKNIKIKVYLTIILPVL